MATTEASRALHEFLSNAKIPDRVSQTGGEFDPRLAAESRAAISRFLGVQLGLVPPKPPKPVAATPATTPATPAAEAKTAAPLKPSKPFAWFKHVQAVESAIRIGDAHFADTLLAMLMEIAEILDDVPMRARLKSQQARVKMEQRQFAEAETMLMEILRQIDPTPHKKSMGGAYCLLALAQCYQQTGKTPNAEKAQAMAYAIAEQLLDAKDPELTLFRVKVGV